MGRVGREEGAGQQMYGGVVQVRGSEVCRGDDRPGCDGVGVCVWVSGSHGRQRSSLGLNNGQQSTGGGFGRVGGPVSVERDVLCVNLLVLGVCWTLRWDMDR